MSLEMQCASIETPTAQSSLSKRVSACRERLQRSRKQPTRHRWGRCRQRSTCCEFGIFKLCRASSLFYPQGRQAAQKETVHSRASKNGTLVAKQPAGEHSLLQGMLHSGHWCVGLKETCWQIERSLADRGFEGMRSTLKPDKPAQRVYRILA